MKKHLLLIFFCGITSSIIAGNIIRVKPNVSDNIGDTWINATNLQHALTIAVDGDEIWVAQGLYKPGSTRDASFVIKPNVKLYGGFLGTEPDIETDYNTRNGSCDLTVLSGDINEVNNPIDNSYHVVTAIVNSNETIVIDGFTITGGYADASGGNTNGAEANKGAGLYVKTTGENSKIIISNCTITKNEICTIANEAYVYGGGLYACADASGFIEVINNHIINNYINIDVSSGNGEGRGFGAGISCFSLNDGVASVANNEIMHNSIRSKSADDGGQANALGGGVHTDLNGGGTITLKYNLISKNKIEALGNAPRSYGAGVSINATGVGIVHVNNNEINENESKGLNSAGGGIFTFPAGGSWIHIDNNKIRNNIVFGDNASGGGVYAYSQAYVSIKGNHILDNIITGRYIRGGGIDANMLSSSRKIDIYNNLVAGNVVKSIGGEDVFGGGIYAYGNSLGDLNIMNNTIAKNKLEGDVGAQLSGSGVATESTGVYISNTIIAKNTGGDNLKNLHAIVQSCLIEGAAVVGTNVINGDPMFANVVTNNFTLLHNSPCINKGDNSLYTSAGGNLTLDLDLTGSSRLFGATIDMGAYESQINIIPPTPQKDNNAKLERLEVQDGEIDLDFNNDNLLYSINVANKINSITINGKAESGSAIVDGFGVYNLVIGENVIKIKVTAEDATVRIYSIVVNRADIELGIGMIEEEKVNIYPTCTRGEVYIETTDEILPTVFVYNIKGQLLLKASTTKVDLTSYPKGIYLLQVGMRMQKIIKQ